MWQGLETYIIEHDLYASLRWGGMGGGGYCVEDSIPASFEAVESIRGGR